MYHKPHRTSRLAEQNSFRRPVTFGFHEATHVADQRQSAAGNELNPIGSINHPPQYQLLVPPPTCSEGCAALMSTHAVVAGH